MRVDYILSNDLLLTTSASNSSSSLLRYNSDSRYTFLSDFIRLINLARYSLYLTFIGLGSLSQLIRLWAMTCNWIAFSLQVVLFR